MKTLLSLLLAVFALTASARAEWIIVLKEVELSNGMVSSEGEVEEVVGESDKSWALRAPDGTTAYISKEFARVISADDAARALQRFVQKLSAERAAQSATTGATATDTPRPMTSTERYQAKRRANEDRARADAAVASQFAIANELSRLRGELLVPNRTELQIRDIKRRIAELERSSR